MRMTSPPIHRSPPYWRGRDEAGPVCQGQEPWRPVLQRMPTPRRKQAAAPVANTALLTQTPAPFIQLRRRLQEQEPGRSGGPTWVLHAKCPAQSLAGCRHSVRAAPIPEGQLGGLHASLPPSQQLEALGEALGWGHGSRLL